MHFSLILTYIIIKQYKILLNYNNLFFLIREIYFIIFKIYDIINISKEERGNVYDKHKTDRSYDERN